MFFHLGANGRCQPPVISPAVACDERGLSLWVVVSANGLALPMDVCLQLIKTLPSLPFGPRAQQGGAVACGADRAGRRSGGGHPIKY